jgi:hypothetical protein
LLGAQQEGGTVADHDAGDGTAEAEQHAARAGATLPHDHAHAQEETDESALERSQTDPAPVGQHGGGQRIRLIGQSALDKAQREKPIQAA